MRFIFSSHGLEVFWIQERKKHEQQVHETCPCAAKQRSQLVKPSEKTLQTAVSFSLPEKNDITNVTSLNPRPRPASAQALSVRTQTHVQASRPHVTKMDIF